MWDGSQWIIQVGRLWRWVAVIDVWAGWYWNGDSLLMSHGVGLLRQLVVLLEYL